MGLFRRDGVAAAEPDDEGLDHQGAEYPGFRWHTLGGHFQDSREFWAKVGAGVSGGYEQ